MNKFEKISKKQYELDALGTEVNYDEIKIPRRATKYSAGYDIFSTVDFALHPGESIRFPTGIKVSLDDDKCLIIVPRSSLGFKYRIQLDNTVGVIDADYYNNKNNEGHMWVKITNDSKTGESLIIKKGDAVAQGIIVKYEKTDDDEAIAERNGGIGSTSKSK